MQVREKKTADSARNRRIFAKYRQCLRFYGITPTIEQMRTNLHSDELFSVFPLIIENRKLFDPIFGEPFPRDLNGLQTAQYALSPTNAIDEIVWAICRCLQYASEINRFVTLREAFEVATIEHQETEADRILTDCYAQFGWSTWLIQSRYSAAQQWGGIERLQEVGSELDSQVDSKVMLLIQMWFMRLRTQATKSETHLKNELLSIVRGRLPSSLERFLVSKIFEQSEMSLGDVAGNLLYEGYSGTVDLYEMLVASIESLVRFGPPSAFILERLRKPVSVLLDKVDDRRLYGPARALGVISDRVLQCPEFRGKSIEAYSRAEYRDCIHWADAALRACPMDMAVYVLRLKAALNLGLPNEPREGLMGVLSRHLSNVLAFNNETYSSAHEILVLRGRYYGHSWINYLRSIVMYELRRETSTFPPPWMVDVYSRDPYISPFSIVSANEVAVGAITRKLKEIGSFPSTLALLKLIHSGESTNGEPIDRARELRYLARYHLAWGDPRVALEHYLWLTDNSRGSERIRSCSGAILALLRLRRFKEALELLVDAYVDAPSVPSAFPIEEAVDVLGDVPSEWPEVLATPLVFDLYQRYCGSGKEAFLAYSFERFHDFCHIRDPHAFVEKFKGSEKDRLVLYLERVWHPDVMRQTLLYNGTKEIEDARIQVCRVLCDLVPENSTRYLDEIKERVKKLEIAKGTTLVEQSKVYVDVEAIRRSLKKKLSDSYARYRSSASSEPSALDSIVDSVSGAFDQLRGDESLPKMLSKLHVISSTITTEADAQFEGLFSDVMREFLRGEHGLNAYLSTRVRHGSLSNTLRKPVEDLKLVTPRDEKRSAYVRNTYWVEGEGRGPAEQALILDALDEFSREYDQNIDFLKDRQLQVVVASDLSAVSEKEDALFVYRTSNLEQKLMQMYDRVEGSLESFIDRCIEILWEKTDDSLTRVREIIEGPFRDGVIRSFDNLSSQLDRINASSSVSELQNAVVKARADTNAKIGKVSTWFRRSEVFDRQDYALEFPVQIALNMIRNAISSASKWNGVRIQASSDDRVLPGRTLDGMVYVFYGLLENAIKRSMVEISDLVVLVFLSYSGGRFSAVVENRTNNEMPTVDDLAKLSQIKEAMVLRQSAVKAQGEDRSGLHKIWATINGPSYRDSALDFRYDDGKFIVRFEFAIEGGGRESVDY